MSREGSHSFYRPAKGGLAVLHLGVARIGDHPPVVGLARRFVPPAVICAPNRSAIHNWLPSRLG